MAAKVGGGGEGVRGASLVASLQTVEKHNGGLLGPCCLKFFCENNSEHQESDTITGIKEQQTRTTLLALGNSCNTTTIFLHFSLPLILPHSPLQHHLRSSPPSSTRSDVPKQLTDAL